MSAVLAHAIVNGRDAAALAPLLAPSPLGMPRVEPVAGLAAVLTCLEGEADGLRTRWGSVEGATALACEHHAILTSLAARVDLVPLRISALLPDADTLLGEIEDRAADFGRLLGRLEGLAELCLSLTQAAPATPPAPPAGGRAFLQARQAQKTAARAGAPSLEKALRAVEEAVSDHLRDSREMPPPARQPGLIRLRRALLVQRAGLPAIEARLPALGAQLATLGVTLDLSGPWAPFHFLDPEERIHA